MMKKHIALFLAIVMALGCILAACDKNPDPTKPKDTNPSDTTTAPKEERKIVAGTKVIMGSTTDLSGDFRWPGFGGSSAGASDQDINKLTVGYSTMETNQDGNYVWNNTAVKSHSEKENEDGTYTITIELNEGLTFSDGSPITAKNYVAYILSFSTPVAAEAGHSAVSGQAFVGFADFHAYTPDSGKGTKEFSGIRMLNDYTFSMTVSTDFYPYYYVETYGAVSPDPLGLVLGDGVDVKDDGNGCYLTDNYYEKSGDEYVKAKEIAANRYDVSKYPYSGPYTITEWDSGTKQATMKANPNFKGNFEGMTPAIETLVYIRVIQETQLNQLTTGALDILSGVTGGADTQAALAIVDNTTYKEGHYQRAGYGKVQFDCDFGPTMFQEVRQAITYLLNRTEFCQAFTGGYGVVVDGPYSPDFTMYQAVKDDIEINDYAYSPANAKKVLEEGGWIYNSKGEPFVEGASGVDAVRYKKLTAEEAEVLDGVNKTYASVSNTDGVTYKTVEINGEYYLPLAINWFGSTPNDVTDMLATTLANSSDVKAAGMVIRSTTGDFTKLTGEIYREPSYGYGGTPTYGMYNLATGWNTTVYDYAFNWSLDPIYFGYSMNKLYDEYDKAFPYGEHSGLTYEEAVQQSGDKLGMDYLSMAMVYESKTGDLETYNKWWQAYIERWNELMPDIPLYSNYYYDVYRANIENFVTTPFFGPAKAILYANVKG